MAKGRDGSTDIYGIIWRPYQFDPAKKYPVIELIYAGPQDSFVPKDFRALHRAQSIAELGFILVQIDGMGTSNRSKAFHEVCWKNLGDAGFPDRIAWLKAAAAKHPEMDITRVGIFGGSAGGQNALGALLFAGWLGYLSLSLNYQIRDWEQRLKDNRAEVLDIERMRREYSAESAKIDQAHALIRSQFYVSGLISDLGRTRPDVVAIDLIEWNDAGIVLRGSLRENSERATAIIGDYVKALIRDDKIGPLFQEIRLADLDRGLTEMARVLKPGGRLVILEITQPTRPPLSTFYSLWFDRIVPLLGAFSGDPEAYSYLPESVRSFPSPSGLAARIDRAGFERIRYTVLAGGIIAIHSGVRE